MIANTNVARPSTNRLERARIVFVLALLIVGCAESPGAPESESRNAGVILLAFDIDSSGVAGNALPTPLRVIVRDERSVVAGATVQWTTSSGRVEPSVSTTDARGVASAVWTLGAKEGAVEATATTQLGDLTRTRVFKSVALEPVVATAIAESNNQSARVGRRLPQPLSVRVSNAAGPKAGVVVRWTASAGSIEPTSVTNSDGVARAEWLLPKVVTSYTAHATVDGFAAPPVTFNAFTLSATVARLQRTSSATRALPANVFARETLSVIAYDAEGDPVHAAPIAWSLPSGALRVISQQSTTDHLGRAMAIVSPLGHEGSAVVTASVPANTVSFQFALSSRFLEIVMRRDPQYQFISAQNNSKPARDTAYIGEEVVWRIGTYDYEQDYQLVAPTLPLLPGGGLYWRVADGRMRVRLTSPGLHHYEDVYTGAVGAILVLERPPQPR